MGSNVEGDRESAGGHSSLRAPGPHPRQGSPGHRRPPQPRRRDGVVGQAAPDLGPRRAAAASRPPPPVNPILEAALEVQRFCRSRRWRFSFIGAIAVQRWGEPRLTQDVDLTVLSGFGPEAGFVDAMLTAYRCRIPGGREFALQRRVLLLEAASGV